MATMPPPNAPPPGGEMPPELPPALIKAADDAEMALARLAKQVHLSAPDSPLFDAVLAIQKAVAEVERGMNLPAEPPVDPMAGAAEMDPMGMPPEGGMMPPDGMPPDMMGGPPPDMMGGPPPDMMGAPPDMGMAPPPMDPNADPFDVAAGETQDMMMEAARRRKGGSY